MNCTEILQKLGVAPDGEPVPFLHEEDGSKMTEDDLKKQMTVDDMEE